MNPKSFILTINGGSSSVKFALFRLGQALERRLSGKIERIGLPDGKLTLDDIAGGRSERHNISAPEHAACVDPLVDLLQQKVSFAEILAVGHRVVHGGMSYAEPERVTPEVLVELGRLSPYDPEHLPSELGLIETFGRKFPELPQVVCFDTAFHRRMPRVARLLTIPRRYEAQGLRRYGFHGLSYEFLMEELQRVGGSEDANGRVILAHLGNGASLAAVSKGRSIDTTMGFTPAAGLPMSTRSGDLDPGIVAYLAKTEHMSVEQFHEMVNSRSGLFGISETSPDMRDLLAAEKNDSRAADAVALFCYQTKKWLGAFAAALGGLDTLVFAGGIGENSPEIRARICRGLEFLGIELDRDRNHASDPVISKAGGKATVRVIRTDEEIQIAKAVRKVMPAQTAEQKT
ncbi:MAG: acetate/propionate family kinase [Candidatus Binatia bacterium]